MKVAYYHAGVHPDKDVMKSLEKAGITPKLKNIDFFEGSVGGFDAVVVDAGTNEDAVTKAYTGAKVPVFTAKDDFSKIKPLNKEEKGSEKTFDPDAPIEGKASKGKASK